jgi:hypothetical protein
MMGVKGNIHVNMICREMINDRRFEEYKRVGYADKAKLYCEALRKIDKLQYALDALRRINK